MANTESHKRKNSKEGELSDDAVVTGLLLWLFYVIFFIPWLWNNLSLWAFGLLWLASSFVVLAAYLLHLVYAKPVEGAKQGEDMVKATILFFLAFSLLGPIALPMLALELAGYVAHIAKKGVVRITARA